MKEYIFDGINESANISPIHLCSNANNLEESSIRGQAVNYSQCEPNSAIHTELKPGRCSNIYGHFKQDDEPNDEAPCN